MVIIRNIVSTISRAVSNNGEVEGRNGYNGSIVKIGRLYYFYRKRKREHEVIAGLSDGWCFGIETSCLRHIFDYKVENIMIETEFNYWEASLHDFIEYGIEHQGIKYVLVLDEKRFIRTPKKDLPKELKDKNVGKDDPFVREMNRRNRIETMMDLASKNQLIGNPHFDPNAKSNPKKNEEVEDHLEEKIENKPKQKVDKPAENTEDKKPSFGKQGALF